MIDHVQREPWGKGDSLEAGRGNDPHHKGQRGRFDGTVEFNRSLCREHYLLRIHLPPGVFPPTRAGQFVQLGCRAPHGALDEDDLLGQNHEWMPGRSVKLTQPELHESLAMLRRPFSLAGRGDDEHRTWIDVIHRVVGVGTGWLAKLRPGDPVDLIGPMGNWFELPEDKSIGFMVGGGVGLPPMFYLAEQLDQAGYEAVGLVGAVTRDLLALTIETHHVPGTTGRATHCTAEFGRFGYPTVITTDDGSCGLHGLVTDGLRLQLEQMDRRTLDQSIIYACGPAPMMHAAADLAAAHGVDCQLCLEQAMACGMGTCQSCVVKIEDEDAAQDKTPRRRPWRYKLACSDGPVFRANQVVWDECGLP